MSNEQKLPDFNEFSRWLAQQSKRPGIRGQTDSLLDAARAARDEFLQAQTSAASSTAKAPARHGTLEVLQLMAAADKSESSRPPEMTTARGFRVTLAYEEGTGMQSASICVLVRCPPELVATVQGETAYLWNGSQRFELGQFDSDGKAIGILPAGIEISLSDFALGKVKLEEPPPDAQGQ
jgi:hypothetical protein